MKKYLLKELAEKLNVKLAGDPNYEISGIGGLDDATSSDISFLANPRYIDMMSKSKAGAVCISLDQPIQEGKNFLICPNPSQSFQQLIEIFIPKLPTSQFSKGIHSTAVIDPTATIDPEANIGPYCVIGAKAHVAKGAKLIAHVFIGEESKVGQDSIIYPHVTIRERCILGDRVSIQPGAVIGSCGFGYITSSQGKHIKLQQLGSVVIEDDVEIGANTTIDRARFHQTKICLGSKIDNLVQLGHNVEIGKHNLIVSQVGVAGSSKTGDYVVLGGQVGVVGHVNIASHTLVGAKAGISKNVLTAGRYTGVPLQPIDDYNRQQVLMRKLPELFEKVKKLEASISTSPKSH
jgi:UDP-3-O-[3-hydroxymyristoyl] glucosamine N-acyltransferase